MLQGEGIRADGLIVCEIVFNGRAVMRSLNMIFVSLALLILPINAFCQSNPQNQTDNNTGVNSDTDTTNSTGATDDSDSTGNTSPFYNKGYNPGYNKGYNPGAGGSEGDDRHQLAVARAPGSASNSLR